MINDNIRNVAINCLVYGMLNSGKKIMASHRRILAAGASNLANPNTKFGKREKMRIRKQRFYRKYANERYEILSPAEEGS
jgi:hypothetical protein